ncbi:MAG TPA: FHA domain-containing protein [Mycobacteriales bacterium]|nr:FHA domain-containing protein [Mycobacteriales bacterium]
MPELVFHLVKLGFLALLWMFVLIAVRTIRLDIFGPRVPRAARPAQQRAAAAPPARAKPKARTLPRQLVVTQGDLAGTTVALSEAPVTIGRSPDSTLVLTDDYASTHHARLVPRNGEWVVEDLGSTNGTYLDKSKVTAPTPVRVGGTIRIGKTVLELRR